MKKWRLRLNRLVFGLLVLGLLFVLLVLAVDWRVARLGRSGVIDLANAGTYDCIIVPGASVYSNGQPSPILRDRLDVAIAAFEAGRSDRILVSGDHGQDNYDEVNAMRDYLLQEGIPPQRIFMDHAGFDTFDTIYRARDVFQVQRALVVTQEFHLLRALYIGQQLGLDLEGVPSDLREYTRAGYYRSREYLARLKAFLECEIGSGQPTFLGEIIPISGDGRATVD